MSPCFVVRLSGLPVDAVESLRAERCAPALQALLALDAEVDTLRRAVSDRLHDVVGDTADPAARRRLVRFRRDVHNLRPLPAETMGAVLPLLRGEATDAVLHFRDRLRERDRLAREVEARFADEVPRLRTRLKDTLRDPRFQAGLLLSSRTLFDRASRYLAAPDRAPGGREEKLERGLLRYLTRAAMKATPFSTFCTVLPGELDEADGAQGGDGALRIAGSLRPVSHVRLNKNLFALLADHLLSRAAVRARLPVEPNPTLRTEDGRLSFLARENGREVFRRLAAGEAIDALLDLAAAGTASLEAVTAELAADPGVDADAETVAAYVERLVELGVLRPCLGVREQEADWDLPLAALLSGIPDEHALAVRDLLVELRTRAEAYGRAGVDARAGLLAAMAARAEACFERLGIRGRPAGGLLVYEDVTADAAVRIAAHADEAPFDHLREWIEATRPLAWPRGEQATMRHFYDGHYPGAGEGVPLLRFYEDFHRQHFKAHLEKQAAQAEPGREDAYDAFNPFGLPSVDRIRTASRAVHERVRTLWRRSPHAAEIALEAADVADAVRGTRPPPGAWSAGVFCQVVPRAAAAGGPRLVLPDGRWQPGYGKYFSRFLYMLPEAVRDRVRAENGALTDEVLAEVAGDAHFNGNLHPPLLPREIAYPSAEGGEARTRLPATALRVAPSPDDPEALVLLDDAGRRVVPVDLGFLSLGRRPALYQLLARFSTPQHFSLRLPAVPEEADAEARDGASVRTPAGTVVHRPRVTYRGTVVLARRAWLVPGALLPRRAPGEEACAFFVRANRWRVEHGIPEEVFVRVEPDAPRTAVAHASRELYRPQYVDFHSPLLVGLLARLAQDVSSLRVAFEERLPAADELPAHEGRRFASELVMQLHFPAPSPPPSPAPHSSDG